MATGDDAGWFYRGDFLRVSFEPGSVKTTKLAHEEERKEEKRKQEEA
jgi:hypothetical protein